MQFNNKIYLVIFLFCLMLNGCGQKGPLTLNSIYIEQEEQEEQEEQGELTENASNSNP